MKTSSVLTGFAFILIIGVIISGCSKQHTETNTSQANTLELLNKLSTFNKSRASLNGNTLRGGCSGFWGCLGKVLAVAGADIAGAAAGIVGVKEAAGAVGIATGGTGAVVVMATAGAITGAGASYTAAFTAVADTPNAHKLGNLTIDAQQFNYLANTGIEHNFVIYDHFYNGGTLQEYYNTKGLSDLEKRAIESNLMRDVATKVNSASEEYTLSNFDFRKLSQRLVNDGLVNPEIKNVLDLFMDAYVVCDSEQAVGEVISYYMTEVVNSGLSSDDKEVLVGSLFVASQSPFFFLDNF